MRYLTMGLLSSMIALAGTGASAQDVLWQVAAGGSGSDSGNGIVQVADGGFLVSGNTASFGAGQTDFWLLRYDDAGNELWNRTYGGALSDVCQGMIATSDGNYLLHGMVVNGDDMDPRIIKVTPTGDVIWDRIYNKTSLRMEGAAVTNTDDGGYLLTGPSNYSPDYHDVESYLLKLDSDGNEVWYHTLHRQRTTNARDVVRGVDDGYLVVGFAGTSMWQPDIWIAKYDLNGNFLWEKLYGDPDGQYQKAYAVAQTPDGNYVVAGYWQDTTPYDALTMKVDAAGNLIWRQTYDYGGIQEEFYDVKISPDGGYAFTGRSAYPAADTVVLRSDADGNLLWDMTYDFGTNEMDIGNALAITADGGIAVVGYGQVASDNQLQLRRLGDDTITLAPVLAIESGSCPGTMGFVVTNVTAGSNLAWAYGFDGLTTIPAGFPCEGTDLDLNYLGHIVTIADGNGEGRLTAGVPDWVCGSVYGQVIDLDTCLKSNLLLVE